MSKLFLIFAINFAFSCSAQGMETFKSWLGFAKTPATQVQIANDQKCPICLDALITTPTAPITQLPCHSKHTFHTECINLWKAHQLSLHGEATCPYCKKAYSKTLKSTIMPSACYAASMLACTGYLFLLRDALDYSKIGQGVFGLEYAANVIIANGLTDRILFGLGYNKRVPEFRPRNIIVTAVALAAGLKYTETILPTIINNDTSISTKTLAYGPLILGYLAASSLLKVETDQ